MLNNMRDIIKKASLSPGIIVGFNIFGMEDARAVIQAAEEMDKPVLLMLNKLAIEYMPIKSWSGLLLPLAEDARVPVSVHLDHCKDFKKVVTAIHEGFTSVMYDGSQLPIEENVKRTREIVKIAQCFNVAVEGEVGSVPYADIPGAAKDSITSVEEARIFAEESGADWMAVAVGQVHRLVEEKCRIKFDLLQEIQEAASLPLVIHGGSGVESGDVDKLLGYHVGKMNYGTGLRLAFGEALKKSIQENPNEYDRLRLFEGSVDAVREEAKRVITQLYNKEA